MSRRRSQGSPPPSQPWMRSFQPSRPVQSEELPAPVEVPPTTIEGVGAGSIWEGEWNYPDEGWKRETISSLTWKDPAADHPKNPAVGDSYYNLTRSEVYVWDGTSWLVVGPPVTRTVPR